MLIVGDAKSTPFCSDCWRKQRHAFCRQCRLVPSAVRDSRMLGDAKIVSALRSDLCPTAEVDSKWLTEIHRLPVKPPGYIIAEDV